MAENQNSADPGNDELLDEPVAIAHVLTVHNVLASGVFACASGPTKLDLDRCCTVLGNSYYNPAEFPALRIDIRAKSNSSVFTISLFESGRIQSTGGCRPMEAKKAMMKIARRVNNKFDYGVKFQNFQIQNVLAVYDFCCPVNVNHFASTFRGIVDYDPERFPAVRVRIPIPNSRKRGVSGGPTQITPDDEEKNRVTQKLRKIMMGDVGNSSETISASNAVGSYLIGASARRPISNKAKEEKLGKEESVTANVFSTGKVTFTGAKSISSLNYALMKLRPAITGIQSSSDNEKNNLNPELQNQIIRLQQQQLYEQHLEAARSHQALMIAQNLNRIYSSHQSSTIQQQQQSNEGPAVRPAATTQNNIFTIRRQQQQQHG